MFSAHQDQVIQLRNQISQKDCQINNYQNLVNKLENDLKKQKDEKDQLTQTVNRFHQQQVGMENQCTRLQKELKQKSEWCQSLQLQVVNIKANQQQQEQESKKVLNQAQSKLQLFAQKEYELQEMQKEYNNLVQQCKSADERLELCKQAYETRIQELQSDISQLSKSFDEAELERQRLKQQISDMGVYPQVQDNRINIDNSSEDKETIERLNAAIRQLEQEKSSLAQELHGFQSVKDEKDALSQQVSSLQSQMQEYKEDCEYNYDVAAKLKQAMIELDQKASEQLEEALKQKMELESRVKSVQADLKEAVGVKQQLELQVETLKQQLEQRTAEVASTTELLQSTKASAYKDFEAERINMLDEFVKVRKQLQEEQNKFQVSQDEVMGLKSRLEEVGGQLAHLQNNLVTACQQRDELRTRAQQIQEQAENQHSSDQLQIDAMNLKIKELQEAYLSGQNMLKEREALILQLEERVHDLNVAREQDLLQAQRLQGQLAEKDNTIDQLRNNIQQLEMSRTMNGKTIEQLRESIREMSNGNQDATTAISSLQYSISQLELELAEAKKELTQQTLERKELVRRYDATVRCLKEDLESKSQIIAIQDDERQKAERGAQDSEFRIQELETQKASMLETCETLEVQIQSITTQFHLEQQQVSQLKNDIKVKEDQLATLERNMEELDTERMQLVGVIDQKSKLLAEAGRKIEEQEKCIGNLKGDYADLGQKANVQETQFQEQKTLIRSQKEQIAQLKEKLEEFRISNQKEVNMDNVAIVEEQERDILQLKNELQMERQARERLAAQLQSEQDRYNRELAQLNTQMRTLDTPKSKQRFNYPSANLDNSPELFLSPDNDTLADGYRQQKEILQNLCDNLTESNRVVSNKYKELRRKFQLLSAKYTTLKKHVKGESLTLQEVGGEVEEFELSPGSDKQVLSVKQELAKDNIDQSNDFKKTQPQTQIQEMDVQDDGDDEYVENKAPNQAYRLQRSLTGNENILQEQQFVIPESPCSHGYVTSQKLQVDETNDSQAPGDVAAKLASAGDEKLLSTPGAPQVLRCKRLSLDNKENTKERYLLSEPVNLHNLSNEGMDFVSQQQLVFQDTQLASQQVLQDDMDVDIDTNDSPGTEGQV